MRWKRAARAGWVWGSTWPACSVRRAVSGGLSRANTRSRGRVGLHRYAPSASQRACHFASRPSRDGFSGTSGRRMALTSRRRELLQLLGYLRQGGVDLGEPRSGLAHHRGGRLLQEVSVGQLGLCTVALLLETGALALQARPLLVQVEQPGQGQEEH